MRILAQDIDGHSALSYAGLIEQIEILRSALRWASRLERPEIEKLARQAGALRDEVVRLSYQERFVRAAATNDSHAALGQRQRREALLARHFVFDGVFGENPRLLEALEVAEKAAPTTLPVLIDGESGTGKELMAKVIHANSVRAERPFVSVNCGAIPHDLLESELFGHRKGAFTGATSDRPGKFECAHGGTIFLDEIGELPLAGQVKLLRVLESHEIQRVGADQTIRVNARIVAATNRDLRRLCADGRFREDLFYRLGVIHLTLPPLRERRDEIPLLLQFFCSEAAAALGRGPIDLSQRLYAFLLDHSWPGNVRELRNLVYRLSCLAGRTADLEHLPCELRPSPAGDPEAQRTTGPATESEPSAAALRDVKRLASDQAERAFLEHGLQQVGGLVTELARRCEMNRTHVQMLLKKHGIRSKDYRPGGAAPQ
jgi:transcriptional regulator with GAF, ATPase, and Fis domain